VVKTTDASLDKPAQQLRSCLPVPHHPGAAALQPRPRRHLIARASGAPPFLPSRRGVPQRPAVRSQRAAISLSTPSWSIRSRWRRCPGGDRTRIRGAGSIASCSTSKTEWDGNDRKAPEARRVCTIMPVRSVRTSRLWPAGPVRL